MKNIKNTNLSTFNINIDPTYLYDGKKHIKNFLDEDKIVGDFNLTLCFGTVTQMQSVLLTNLERQKSGLKSKQERVGVQLDERLGILVKRKEITRNEISVQVEIEEQIQQGLNKDLLDESAKFIEPYPCDQSIISHTSQNEFINDSFAIFTKAPMTEVNNLEILPKPVKATNLKTVT